MNILDFKYYSVVFLKDSVGNIVGQAIIDKEDKERVGEYNWSLANSGYAVAWIEGKTTTLQQFIHGRPKENNIIHHINEDRLDNRKANLDEISRNMNALLSSSTRSNTGRRGVYYNKRTKTYTARIKIGGKNITLGSSKDFMEAVKFRERAERKYIYNYEKQI